MNENVRTLTKFAEICRFFKKNSHFFSKKVGISPTFLKKQKRTERSHNEVSVISPLLNIDWTRQILRLSLLSLWSQQQGQRMPLVELNLCIMPINIVLLNYEKDWLTEQKLLIGQGKSRLSQGLELVIEYIQLKLKN